jgi:aspartate carbamoyltransferase regulatory subunit
MYITPLQKQCHYCDETFQSKRKDKKFCSSRCKHRYFLEKEQENDLENVYQNVSDNPALPIQNIKETFPSTHRNVSQPEEKCLSLRLLPAIIPKKPFQERNKTQSIYTDYEEIKGGQDQQEEEDIYKIEGRLVTKEEFYGLPVKNAKPKYSVWDREKVKKANLRIYEWLKHVIILCKRPTVTKKEIKELINEIEEYLQDSDYNYLPANYEYKAFLEKELLKRLRRVGLLMDMEKIRLIQLEIDDTDLERWRKLAFELHDLN